MTGPVVGDRSDGGGGVIEDASKSLPKRAREGAMARGCALTSKHGRAGIGWRGRAADDLDLAGPGEHVATTPDNQ